MAIKVRDHKLISNLEHNDASGASKELNSGFPFSTSIATAPAGAVLIGRKKPVRIVNSSGSTIFVSFGDSTLAAPTGMTDGIAILNGTVEYLNSGYHKYIRFNASSASVQYALADDDGSGEA